MVQAMFKSYAQNGEDIVLWRALHSIEAGTYVDVGAADPDVDSVTKAFYERGWSGVNIEPSREHASALRSARPRDIVLEECAGDRPGTIMLHVVKGTGLSTVVESAVEALHPDDGESEDVEVPVRRLDQMLDDLGFAGKQIHFLKIDVEGFEESVLRGIDLARWRPWVIVVEATAPRSRTQVHENWEHVLLDAGYNFCLFDGLNRFYAAAEHDELSALLASPACVFDQPYMTPPHADVMRMYETTLADYSALVELYQKTIDDYGVLRVTLTQSTTDYQRVEAELLQARADIGRVASQLDQTSADYQRVESGLVQTSADYQRVESELLQAQRDFGRVAAELVQTSADYQRVESELLQAQRDFETATSLYDRAIAVAHAQSAEAQGLLDDRRTLLSGISSMGEEIERLRRERDAFASELTMTRQTVSWRVTSPLRRLRRLRGH
jgi:FkbM family methyltransferase